jgi:hypothetical protein
MTAGEKAPLPLRRCPKSFHPQQALAQPMAFANPPPHDLNSLRGGGELYAWRSPPHHCPFHLEGAGALKWTTCERKGEGLFPS